MYDWLKMLGLEQYYGTLANQGYDNIDSLTDIMWEDLEEIGIQKLGKERDGISSSHNSLTLSFMNIHAKLLPL